MKVAMFLSDGYEEAEAILTADLLKRANIIVDLISLNNKEVISVNNFNIKIDINFDKANYQDYQAFILPGGWDHVINLKQSDKLKKWLINANQEQKIIAGICAASVVLAEFGLLNDKEYTIYPSCLEEVKNIGKINNKLSVIMDGNIITSPSLGCVFPFALKLVEKIHSKDRSLEMEKKLLLSTTLKNDENYSTNSNSESESDDKHDFFDCKNNLENYNEINEDIFYDALDNFDFLTNYNKIELDEMQKLNPPIIPEKLWTSTITANDVLKNEIDNAVDSFKYFNNDNNILEILDELTFGIPEKALDALEFFKDEGYNTNSNSESESDDKHDFFDCKNNLENYNEINEDIFYDALDNFDFLTNYNKIELDEMQKLNPPIIPEKLWTSTITANDVLKNEIDNAVDSFKYFNNDNNILEILDELTFGIPEKALDALEFFKDEGYNTNSNSESESDDEKEIDSLNNLLLDNNSIDTNITESNFLFLTEEDLKIYQSQGAVPKNYELIHNSKNKILSF